MESELHGKRILIHTCCGPCLCGVIERVLSLGLDPTVFFFNPNIYPKEEYLLRLDSTRKVADWFNVRFIEPISDWEQQHDEWLERVGGLEEQHEGGPRCFVCYSHRLRYTARFGKTHGYDLFTTTLMMGPMKDAERILRLGEIIGKEEEGIQFLNINFRKRGGYSRSIELSKQLGLYRQNYCGCEFSLRSINIASPKEKNRYLFSTAVR